MPAPTWMLHSELISLLWSLLCFARWTRDPQPFPHTSQYYRAPLIWSLKCLTRLCRAANLLWHTLHSWFFSSACVTLCLINWLFWAHTLSQTSHSYTIDSVSPSCALSLCFVKLCLAENDLWHAVHSWFFSPLWTLRCFVKTSDLANSLLQNLHS